MIHVTAVSSLLEQPAVVGIAIASLLVNPVRLYPLWVWKKHLSDVLQSTAAMAAIALILTLLFWATHLLAWRGTVGTIVARAVAIVGFAGIAEFPLFLVAYLTDRVIFHQRYAEKRFSLFGNTLEGVVAAILLSVVGFSAAAVLYVYGSAPRATAQTPVQMGGSVLLGLVIYLAASVVPLLIGTVETDVTPPIFLVPFQPCLGSMLDELPRWSESNPIVSPHLVLCILGSAQVYGLWLAMGPVLDLGRTQPAVLGSIVVSLVCTCVLAWGLSRLADKTAESAANAGGQKSETYEWRLVGSDGKFRDATIADVYEHQHGSGSWRRKIDFERKTWRIIGLALAAAAPVLTIRWSAVVTISNAGQIVLVCFLLVPSAIVAYLVASK